MTSTSPDENGQLGALNRVPNRIPDTSEGCDLTVEFVQTQLQRAVACTTQPGTHATSLTSTAPCETAADCGEPRVPGVEAEYRPFAAPDEGICASSVAAVVTPLYGSADPAAELAEASELWREFDVELQAPIRAR